MSNIQLPVQITTRKIVKPNLEIFYPFIVAGANTNAILKMNQQIYNLVNKLIIDQGYYQSPHTTSVNGYYEIKTNERGVLSLTIINYTYRQHAAHGLTIMKSLNFDTSTGNNYQLFELFKPGSDYKKVLSEIIQKQIKERDIPLLDGFKGVESNQDYYIADKALVIYYQLYELTAYVYGFPMFPISVYEIQNIINENSLLGVMAVNM